MAMNLQRVGRWLKSANGTATSPNWALIAGTFWCGSFSKPSSRPSSCMISSVEGWMVSPRKSRRKSACFSSTMTAIPARARRKPSIIPAGPPPAMQQVVARVRGATRAARVSFTLAASLFRLARAWPGHPRLRRRKKGVDARIKSGQDEEGTKYRSHHLAPRPIRPEADAGARQAAADADRRAVGAPAGGAGHRAVDGEFDGIHPAGDMRFDRDVVAALAQRLANALREGVLDLDGTSLRPDSRRLDRLLQRHAVIDEIDQRLHRRAG